MITIRAADVGGAYRQGIRLLHSAGQQQESRAGEVLVYPSPVLTITERPCRRVLLCPERRANPFFHLFESLWMLAGRNDATWLDRFVSDFSSRFAEPDGIMWGAYGRRWRKHFERDQIEVCVDKLRRDPLDRRVVISMWDPDTDLVSEELTDTEQPARDLPCNTHIYLRVVGGALDLTVCCRSNDAYWGAHGANAVHFSVLQEYLAARIGVLVGHMYQLSNNYHGYIAHIPAHVPLIRTYPEPLPMVAQQETWDADLAEFLWDPEADLRHLSNKWFCEVAQPMWQANEARLARDWALYEKVVPNIHAADWRAAAEMWVLT